MLVFIDMPSQHGIKRKQADSKATTTELLVVVPMVLRLTSGDLAVPLRRNYIAANLQGISAHTPELSML